MRTLLPSFTIHVSLFLTISPFSDGNGNLGEEDLRGYDPPLTNSFITQLLSTKPTTGGGLVCSSFSCRERATVSLS